MYDVAVVGAGPAGLSASIALACEGKKVVLVDQANHVGGQISHSHLVENVVGYPGGFDGESFSHAAYTQAVGLGVDVMLGQQVAMLSGTAGNFAVITPDTTYHARTILLTIGVAPRPLPFQVVQPDCNVTNELCLQPAMPGEHVLVYGGGNSAGQAACYYAKMGCKVTILSRRPLEETMDGRWVASLESLGVERVIGEIQHVDNDTVVFQSSGEVQNLIPHTVHSFLGGEPITGWVYGWVEVDEGGYIITDDYHCTSTYGIFAAGDCESDSIKRFSCALGGATEAVHAIHRYLLELEGVAA